MTSHVYAHKKATVVGSLPTVILVEKLGNTVKFLTDTQIGDPDYPWITVVSMNSKEFETQFARADDDLVAIAKIYHAYAQELGATPEALNFLGLIFKPVEKEIIDMATSTASVKKGVAKAPAKVVKPGAKAAPAEAPKKVAKVAEPKAEKEPKVKAAKEPKEPKVKRPSVSSRICDLILEGTLTDDQIFAKVQSEFDLDDSKRGYISWNRNFLRKQGANPPEPVGGKTRTKSEEPAAKATSKVVKSVKVMPKTKPGLGKGDAASARS